MRKHSKFFAKGGGRRWLPMGSRKHWNVSPLDGPLPKSVHHRVGLFQPHPGHTSLHHQCIGQVVDVFTSGSKVGKFRDGVEPHFVEDSAEKIFDSLDVVLSFCLDLSERLSVFSRKVGDSVAK